MGTSTLPAESFTSAIRLFHNRWSVPTVAVLFRDGPGRFSALFARLGASRDTFSETLGNLVASGLVARSEGTRPVYSLTVHGESVGVACIAAARAVQAAGVLQVALKKWPMPALVAVGRGHARYRDLVPVLTGITPRALAASLKDLILAGLVERHVGLAFPPATSYTLTAAGRELFPAIDVLIRACAALQN